MPRQNSKQLNVSDAPELMPGAGRRGGARFEGQCKSIYETTCEIDSGSDEVAMVIAQQKLERAVMQLSLCFPSVDEAIIREQYLMNSCNSERTADILLVLSDDPTEKSTPPPTTEDKSVFPTLSEAHEEWELVENEEMILNEDEFKCQRSWAERARDGAGWAVSAQKTSPVAPASMMASIFTPKNGMSSPKLAPTFEKSRTSTSTAASTPKHIEQCYDFEIRKSRGRRRRGPIIETERDE